MDSSRWFVSSEWRDLAQRNCDTNVWWWQLELNVIWMRYKYNENYSRMKGKGGTVRVKKEETYFYL